MSKDEEKVLVDLRRRMSKLPERMQKVLSLRYGIEGCRLSLAEVGRVLKVSAGRVYQIEAKALLIMRRPDRKS